MCEILHKKGFSFIEVLSPCPTLYQRRNNMEDGLETMKFYREHGKTKNGSPVADAVLSIQGDFMIGKFVDRERPDYYELMHAQLARQLGTRFAPEEAA